jgi:hypothetical protein
MFPPSASGWGTMVVSLLQLLGHAGMQLTDKSQSMLMNTKIMLLDRGHDCIATKPLSGRKYILLKRLLIALPIEFLY